MERESRRHWDEVSDEWAARTPHQLWRRYSDQLHQDFVRDWLPPGPVESALKTDLFDEAVGPSGLHALLGKTGARVFGMDLSPQTAGRARKRHGLKTVAADARQLPFADASLDLVVSNSTLDHMPSLDDVERALVELLRVLKPGGELLLTLDNLANPAVALRNALPYHLLHRLGLVPYRMGATCGPRRLARLLRHTGFEVRDQRALMHCPRVFAVLLADLLDRFAGEPARLALMRTLLKCEGLGSLPTRYLTGYFVAARAVRPDC